MSRNRSTTIGLAGCGAMGLPMAERLVAAGVEVRGFDVRPAAEFGSFAERMVADPADFAARCDILISVVRDARQTLDLLFDDQAVMAGGDRPSTVVLSSTLSPRFVAEVAERLPAGTALIDAPMSGAPYRARAGTLTFMVGGPDEAVSELMPAFRAMGETVHHLGPTGAGAAAKVLNNFVAATGVVAVRRAMRAAEALGFDAALLREVMRSSSGSTWYGDNFEAIDWSREGYDPENTIGILEKDVACYVDALTQPGAPEPGPLEAAVVDELRRLEELE